VHRDTDVDALAKFLTALDMGLIYYGIVAREPEARARIIGVVERMLSLGADSALV
jgi:hypothetical protein